MQSNRTNRDREKEKHSWFMLNVFFPTISYSIRLYFHFIRYFFSLFVCLLKKVNALLRFASMHLSYSFAFIFYSRSIDIKQHAMHFDIINHIHLSVHRLIVLLVLQIDIMFMIHEHYFIYWFAFSLSLSFTWFLVRCRYFLCVILIVIKMHRMRIVTMYRCYLRSAQNNKSPYAHLQTFAWLTYSQSVYRIAGSQLSAHAQCYTFLFDNSCDNSCMDIHNLVFHLERILRRFRVKFYCKRMHNLSHQCTL